MTNRQPCRTCHSEPVRPPLANGPDPAEREKGLRVNSVKNPRIWFRIEIPGSLRQAQGRLFAPLRMIKRQPCRTCHSERSEEPPHLVLNANTGTGADAGLLASAISRSESSLAIAEFHKIKLKPVYTATHSKSKRGAFCSAGFSEAGPAIQDRRKPGERRMKCEE
jgi:hypothetical protein